MCIARPFVLRISLILSPLLLPPWICHARAAGVPRLASPAPTLDVSCSPHCCPSLILSHLLPSWMFLLIALLSLPHLVTLAPILDVSCSSPCCLSLILSPLLSARAVLGGFLPFVSWLTHSCHHCIGYHGNFLVVPLLRHHWRHCLCHHGHFFLLVPLSIHHGHYCLRHNFHFLPLMPSLTHHCHQCFFHHGYFLLLVPLLALILPPLLLRTTFVMSCCPLVPLLTFIVTILTPCGAHEPVRETGKASRKDWQKPAVGLAGAKQQVWQKPVARIGAEKEKSASCLPPSQRGCVLLVPLLTPILSPLLPLWMFLARAIVDPHLATIDFASRMTLVRAIVVSHHVTIAAATLGVCCSCHC